MRWLYLHLPHLQLDALQPDHQAEQARPLIIVGPAPHPIVQCNALAKEAGLKLGMGLAHAASLCQRLTILSHDSDFEQRRLLELANASYQLTADIVLSPPDGLAFDIRGMLRLYGSLDAYLHAIRHLLASQQVTAVLACANTLSAARVLAINGIAHEEADHGMLHQKLGSLTVAQLPLSLRQQQLLQRLGIDTLSDIEALPRDELGPRVGLDILDLLDRIRGRKADQCTYFTPQPRFERSLILEHEISHSQALLFPLQGVLQHLQDFLRQRACRVQNLHIVLGYRDHSESAIVLASGEPESHADIWRNLLQLKLDNLKLPAPVVRLRLSAERLLEADDRHGDLFHGSSGMSPSHLLGRLQAKLGDQAVQRFVLQADYRPEQAFRYDSLMQFKSQKNVPLPPPALRPSLLLDPPRALTETIRIVHGPERIQTAWWSDEAICRDYFVARNQQGQTLWVYRDREQRWFVQGLFA